MKRPRRVTWLAAALALGGAAEGLGAWELARQAGAVTEFVPADRVVWLPAAAAATGLAGLWLVAAAVGLWRMARWGWWLAMVAPLPLAAAHWTFRLLLARSDYDVASRPVGLAATVGLIALVWLTLGWTSIRRRFR